MHRCFKSFSDGLLNLRPPFLSLCLSAGHELLSELQQRRFNGSEGGGGGQGGEAAVHLFGQINERLSSVLLYAAYARPNLIRFTVSSDMAPQQPGSESAGQLEARGGLPVVASYCACSTMSVHMHLSFLKDKHDY